VANAFNLVSIGVIFQELYATRGDIIQFIPFVRAFYAFKFPLFYSHCNHEGDVTASHLSWGFVKVILGGGTLFVLTHFRALHSRASHFLFLSISIHCRWHSHHRFPINCIICIWTFLDWTSCNMSFYAISEMCSIITFWPSTRFQHPIPIYHPIWRN